MVFQAEDRTKAKRQQADLAIRAALEGRWSDAAELNQTIVNAFPADVDALNRLGKAMTELGKYKEARGAYMKTLELDSLNAIARKNLSKLETMDKKTKKKTAGEKLPPHMFIEETGKTGNTILIRPSMKVAVAMSGGDRVNLRKDKRGALFVDNMDGEQIGEVEPKLAQRLVKLMESGNEYVGAISSVSDQGVRVFIRESFQHASNVGKLSFPPSATEPAESIRPYLKTRLVRDEGPLYKAGDDDDEDWDSADDSGESGVARARKSEDSDEDDEDDDNTIDEPDIEIPDDDE
jgi:tetratricopeptide (TPR) repeat protein